MILQKFQYSLENNSEKQKIKEKIIEANKILIDDYEYNGLIKLPTLGSAIELEEDDIKIVNMFAEENSIKINKDFFDVGDVGYFSVMPGQGNYTGTKKSIEKYEILSEIIDDVKEYYQVLEYKRNLNNLYFLELVVIKAKENLLFPCRIFLKEPIEIIKYTISSKFNDKIIEREISIK